ncbi:MAG: 1-acyl-sn-glycerol-3-phosphate acyltransferase [Acidobacteria bacterium]|nr:1-acyl-sn-glycerol-3-phosphate acyltransferase [Acidobacteriota bacterium]
MTSSEAYETAKTLRWRDMVFLGKGSILRQLLHAAISIALRLFFRRIETVDVERVPLDEPLIFVLNHPNGLIDPALIFVSLPRRVSFLAKSTLFRIPVGGRIVRALEALPVYRRIDADGEMAKNLETFRRCRELLAQNRCIAIFPEGLSHDETKLKPIKTGAARIALGALSVEEGEEEKRRKGEEERNSLTSENRTNDIGLKIMAVGLFYTSKTAFRSEVLIRYGEILDVAPVALDENGEPPKEAVRELTGKIEKALRRATLNLDTEAELDAVLKAEALFSSVYNNLLFKQTLTQSFRRLQNLAEKYELLGRHDPERRRALGEKIAAYENDLKTSGVTAASLSVLQHPTWYVFRYLVLRLFLIALLAPLAIAGAFLHSPAFVFSNFVGLLFKTHGADAAGSTYKILAAMLLMPLTWLVTALVVLYFFGWQWALLSIPLAILCGYVALRSSETLIDLTVWLRSAWLLFRQRALFLRLLLERETLQKEIGELID